MSAAADRLLGLYARASAEQRAQGRAWYRRERARCEWAGGGGWRCGDPLPWSPELSCAVAAAYSPRVPWQRALTLTRATWRDSEPVGHTRANMSAVWRLINGHEPEDVLRGPKVRAFFEGLMGDTSAAVVDVHMWRALGLEPGGPARYERAAECLTEAAHRVCEPVTSFQATVWIVQRGNDV